MFIRTLEVLFYIFAPYLLWSLMLSASTAALKNNIKQECLIIQPEETK